jgi:hypothetical protein
MYNLHGIIVSESHIINYKDKWIPVKVHPEAQKINNYKEPYLYCLNTSTKTIILNDIVFTDWDEIYDKTLECILNHENIEKPENIENLYYGFNKNTIVKLKNGEKPMEEITIGDKLSTDGVVYGIVELNNNLGNNTNKKNDNEILYHLLVSNKYFETRNSLEADYNNIIDGILESIKILSKEYV